MRLLSKIINGHTVMYWLNWYFLQWLFIRFCREVETNKLMVMLAVVPMTGWKFRNDQHVYYRYVFTKGKVYYIKSNIQLKQPK